MSARARAASAESAFAAVEKAFAGDTRVSRKKMFNSPNVLAVNGKIFAMLAHGRFVAKLPRTRVDTIVADGAGERFDPGHGRLMKEWVSLHPGHGDWVGLAREALAFVAAKG